VTRMLQQFEEWECCCGISGSWFFIYNSVGKAAWVYRATSAFRVWEQQLAPLVNDESRFASLQPHRQLTLIQ